MAIERPHVGRFPAQQIVCIRVSTARAGMGEAIGSALHEIHQVLAAQQITPKGLWFAHYLSRPKETFDFDVCFPVAEPVALSGRLQAASLPEVDVIRTSFHGQYEGLPAAWREFLGWVQTKRYAVRDDFFEVYSINSQDTAEADTWQTDLMIPLIEGEAGKERLV